MNLPIRGQTISHSSGQELIYNGDRPKVSRPHMPTKDLTQPANVYSDDVQHTRKRPVSLVNKLIQNKQESLERLKQQHATQSEQRSQLALLPTGTKKGNNKN